MKSEEEVWQMLSDAKREVASWLTLAETASGDHVNIQDIDGVVRQYNVTRELYGASVRVATLEAVLNCI